MTAAERLDAAIRDLDNPTPCVDVPQVFERASDGYLERWSAATYCARCPVSGPCGEAGMEGREIGVWGGLFSPDGLSWKPIGSLNPKVVMANLTSVIGKKKGKAALQAAGEVFPALGDFFAGRDQKGDGGQRYKRFLGQCIIRSSRSGPLPDGRVGSYRRYILTSLMNVPDDQSWSAYSSCATEDCIAPWHLRWSNARSSMYARETALAVYLLKSRESWTFRAISDICGVPQAEVSSMRAILPHMEATVNRQTRIIGASVELVNRRLKRSFLGDSARHRSAALRIAVAADLLDCDTIEQLAEVGKSEY